MRRIVVPLRRLPSGGGLDLTDLVRCRVDTACRLVSAALFLSRGVRENVEVELLLSMGGARTLHISGGRVADLRPDEQTIARRLDRALSERPGSPLADDGLSVCEGGFARTLDSWDSRGWTVALELTEDGDCDLDGMARHIDERQSRYEQEVAQRMDKEDGGFSPGTVVALIGDGEGLDEGDATLFRAWATRVAGGVLRVRSGGLSLLGSHCIVLLHHFLDRAHACTGMPKGEDVLMGVRSHPAQLVQGLASHQHNDEDSRWSADGAS